MFDCCLLSLYLALQKKGKEEKAIPSSKKKERIGTQPKRKEERGGKFEQV
jgi:hypothetical protein